MARFEITILKAVGGYKWVNTYEVSATDLLGGQSIGDAIVAQEKLMHYAGVQFEQMKTSLVPNPTGQEFITKPLTGTGARGVGITGAVGPETVLFAQFGSNKGRPGKKFYRYVLAETQVKAEGEATVFESQVEEDDYRAFINNIYTAIINAGSTLYIGKSGKTATGAINVAVSSQNTRHGWYNRKPATGTTTGAGV